MTGVISGEPIFLSAHPSWEKTVVFYENDCIKILSPLYEVARCFIVNHRKNAIHPSTNDILVKNIYLNIHDLASNCLFNKKIKNTLLPYNVEHIK